MRIETILVRNFRALSECSVDLSENLSLIIGKNNSGKTSFLTVLDKFLNRPSSFTFDDLSSSEQLRLKRLIESQESISDSECFSISMDVIICHSEGGDEDISDLKITDLSEDSNSVTWRFEWRLPKVGIEEMQADYKDLLSKLDRYSLAKFLKKNGAQYFKPRSISVDTEGRHDVELTWDVIKRVLNLQIISARREVANEGSNKTLSHLSHNFFSKKTDPGEEHRIQLKKAILEADEKLEDAYIEVFGEITSSIERLSPSASKMSFKSELDELNILQNNTSIVYKEEGLELPEDHNGLGYMNFYAMVFHVHTICDEFRKTHKDELPAKMNILFIEEPEAHTHPQMQYVFIQNIRKLLDEERMRGGHEGFKLQTIITTHSPHIASRVDDFNDVRHFQQTDGKVTSKNLSDLKDRYGEDEEGKRNYRFLKQYLTIHKAELFFAEKAVLIEGDTERILLPAMMSKLDREHGTTEEYCPLLSQNISVIDVGANSKVFEHFLDFISIKTLVITDIDSVGNDRKACAVCNGTGTSNASIKYFLRGKSLAELVVLPDDEKMLSRSNAGDWIPNPTGTMRIAYQAEDRGYHARSFEDAFIADNMEFLIANKDNFAESLEKKERFVEGANDYFEMARDCIASKTGFATDILFYSQEDYSNWKTPKYINEGLLWLSRK